MSEKSECPYCASLKRIGVDDAETALEYNMIWNNCYIREIVKLLGADRAEVIAGVVTLKVEEEMKKRAI